VSRILTTISRRVALWVFALWCLFPIYWLLTMSLKTEVDAMARRPKLIFMPIMDNYAKVISDPAIWSYFANSAIVALGSTLIALLIGIPPAYVLARYRFRGNADYGFWVLTTRMTPPVAVLIPFFVMYVKVGLVNTHIGLIIAHVAINLSIVVWLMKGFFDDLPSEMEEAAAIDGATYFQAFSQICLPVVLPGVAAVAILAFLFSWNEFLFALVLGGNEVRTVPLGLYAFVGYQQVRWGELSAASIVLLLPVLAFVMVFQKQLIRGLTMGAVK
jgi:multiple sugar transport system permease protein